MPVHIRLEQLINKKKVNSLSLKNNKKILVDAYITSDYFRSTVCAVLTWALAFCTCKMSKWFLYLRTAAPQSSTPVHHWQTSHNAKIANDGGAQSPYLWWQDCRLCTGSSETEIPEKSLKILKTPSVKGVEILRARCLPDRRIAYILGLGSYTIEKEMNRIWSSVATKSPNFPSQSLWIYSMLPHEIYRV